MQNNAQRGAASVAALLLLATAASLVAAVLYAVKGEVNDVRHYAVETRLRLVAEGNADAFVKRTAAGELPQGRLLANGEEFLAEDRRDGDIRRRIYLKGDATGMTVFSFADVRDTDSGLRIFKQTKIYMEQKDGGYIFKYRLP